MLKDQALGSRFPQVNIEVLKQSVETRQALLERKVLCKRHEMDLVIRSHPIALR